MIIYFYKKQFSKYYSIRDHFKIDQLSEILPKDIKVIIGNDRELLKIADTVVVDLPIIQRFLDPDEKLEKQDRQVWVAWDLECDVNYPWILSDNIKDFFDIWMTYHIDSDVYIPYFSYEYKDLLLIPPKQKEKNVCMFISSMVNKSGRMEYVLELMKYINIDSYGRWMKNCEIREDKGYTSKMDIISKYKFTIAFENAIGEDYVTEKFYEPLLSGSVPVYMGAPNIRRFSPGNDSYLDVRNYLDPKDLAKAINNYCRHDELYCNLLEWKNRPLPVDLVDLIETQRIHPILRLAEKVKDIRIKKLGAVLDNANCLRLPHAKK